MIEHNDRNRSLKKDKVQSKTSPAECSSETAAIEDAARSDDVHRSTGERRLDSPAEINNL